MTAAELTGHGMTAMQAAERPVHCRPVQISCSLTNSPKHGLAWQGHLQHRGV